MRLGASLFLLAAGAILRFAVTDTVRGVDLKVVGLVLIVVGAVGLLAEIIIWVSHRRTDVVVRDSRRMNDPYDPPRY